jgi:hypothetical protein
MQDIMCPMCGPQPCRHTPDVECRRCGRQIIAESGRWWFHIGADGFPRRGCRAATFTVADGWDDTIPRSWSAKP